MTENQNSTIHINEINLRVPGGAREDGLRYAHEIAERLADRIPDGISGRLGMINLKIPISSDRNGVRISDQVADAIVDILRRNRHA
jgi:hypothetical protein